MQAVQQVKVSDHIAGRLKFFYENWKGITKSTFILNCIRGYKIPFRTQPRQRYFEMRTIKGQKKLKKVEDAINELMKKGAIVKTQKVKNQFLSSYFLGKKADGSHRFILNLKKLNNFVKIDHFKLEDLRTATKLISEGDFMISIDLQDAYLLVPVHPDHQRFLMFKFKGRYYKFICLPFGLCSCPYVFTKILKPVVQKLRSLGLRSVIYLDDWLCIASNFEECMRNGLATIELLENLGFVINFKKSKLDPEKSCKYLGVIINSNNCTLTLTEDRKEGIIKGAERLIKKSSSSIMEVARLLGKLVAACVAVQYGWLYTKILEREKLEALRKSGGSYLGKIKITDKIRSELKWWLKELRNSERSFRIVRYTQTIYTDSSDFGWGATDGKSKIFGSWGQEIVSQHINYKELLVVQIALTELAKNQRNGSILLRIDNTTAIAYINRMGGVKFEKYNSLAREIWQWAEERGIWLTASYITSEKNLVADQLSRMINPDAEWELCDKAFQFIVDSFGLTEIDLFASELNKKCENYVSRFPDKEAWQVDAFSISWAEFFFYAFPPFNLVIRTLEKIREDQAEGILVVPEWKSQPWYPMLMKLIVAEPIIFEPNSNLLISLCREKTHPRAGHLRLMATIVSGRPLN